MPRKLKKPKCIATVYRYRYGRNGDKHQISLVRTDGDDVFTQDEAAEVAYALLSASHGQGDETIGIYSDNVTITRKVISL